MNDVDYLKRVIRAYRHALASVRAIVTPQRPNKSHRTLTIQARDWDGTPLGGPAVILASPRPAGDTDRFRSLSHRPLTSAFCLIGRHALCDGWTLWLLIPVAHDAETDLRRPCPCGCHRGEAVS